MNNLTTVDNTVDTEPQQERKQGVHIPGAVWPDPKNSNFGIERRDPFTRMDRDAPLKRRHTDIYDKADDS